MIVVTIEMIPGHRVTKVVGQVFGVTVRSRGIGGNVMAGLRSIVGGETHVASVVEDPTAVGAGGDFLGRLAGDELLGR